MDYSKVVDSVFHPDPSLPSTVLHESGRSKVYRVDTPEPVIVRITAGTPDSYQFQADLLAAIAGQDNLTPRILHWEMREIDGQPYAFQVQTFLPGKQLERYPDPMQSRAITQATHRLHQRLCKASRKLDTSATPRIDEGLLYLVSQAADGPFKRAGRRLLENERFTELVSQPEQCLIHFDLWYKNFLLHQSDEGIEVGIIDIDYPPLGPRLLQPAVLFSAGFLVSSFLLPSDDPDPYDLDALIAYWPERVDKRDLLLLMQLFPITLGILKEGELAEDPEGHAENLESIELLMKCLEYIEAASAVPHTP